MVIKAQNYAMDDHSTNMLAKAIKVADEFESQAKKETAELRAQLKARLDSLTM
jgi:hypothetical protein